MELLHGHFLGNAVREDRLIDSHPVISMVADLIAEVKSEKSKYVSYKIFIEYNIVLEYC